MVAGLVSAWAEKAEARALLRIEQSHLAEGHGAIGHFSNTSSSAPARPLVSPYTEDASIQGRINLFVGYVRRKISKKEFAIYCTKTVEDAEKNNPHPNIGCIQYFSHEARTRITHQIVVKYVGRVPFRSNFVQKKPTQQEVPTVPMRQTMHKIFQINSGTTF